jgi:hypothetical protein
VLSNSLLCVFVIGASLWRVFDSGHTLVCAEDGYPKGSPNTNN